MQKIYVCSPYRGHPDGIEEGRRLATQICKTIERNHHAPFAPHLIYPSFLNDEIKRERESATEMGFAWMSVSDKVLSYEQFGISSGMQEELELADELEISVIRFKTLEEIDNYFKKEYENAPEVCF
jgi:hypothetical protein